MKTILLCLLLISASAAESERILLGFEPGCWAKCSTAAEWPIEQLPDAPGEVVRLMELPTVTASAADRDDENADPNHLLTDTPQGILAQAPIYIVEFEGWFKAEHNGLHSIGVQTDDPVQVFLEGRLLAEHQHSAWRPYDHEQAQRDVLNPLPRHSSIHGSAQLSAGRWYHLLIVCRQQWGAWEDVVAKGSSTVVKNHFTWYERLNSSNANWHPFSQDALQDYNARHGAHFKAWLQRPAGEAGPIPLHLPIFED